MKVIYKYSLEFQPEQTIEMPVGFQILDMQKQHGVPCIWALVDSESTLLFTRIYIYGTGENLVFHVFYKIL